MVCIFALALGTGYFLYRTATAKRPAQPAGWTATSTAAQAEPRMDSASIAHKQPTHRVAASTSTAPLPPPGTPLKDIYDELAARARSGDRAAS
ncbi:MAG TPA: hypothetical protein VLK26_09580, partial [Rudaea sp.]|nr:hypothetical protein [Rudaea sp.]